MTTAGLRHLLGSLPPRGLPRVRAMPVDDIDPDDETALAAAAAAYAADLPERFDLIHLGLGRKGHRLALPDDAALDVRDRLVAITGPYQGRRG